MRNLSALLLSSILLSACGGGGGGGGTGGSNNPVTPVTQPPTTTASETVNVGPGAATVPLPAVGGFTGLIEFPSTSAAATLQITATTIAPAGISSVQLRHRNATSSGETTYLYILITGETGVQMLGTFDLSVNLPPTIPTAQTFYLAVMAQDKTWQTVTGIGAINGQNVQVGIPAQISIPKGATLPLAFYSGAFVNAGPPVAASPTSLNFAGPGQTLSTTISGNKSTETFSADGSGCIGIATAALVSNAQLNVTSVGPGSCLMLVRDQAGDTLGIPVTVASTTVVIQ